MSVAIEIEEGPVRARRRPRRGLERLLPGSGRIAARVHLVRLAEPLLAKLPRAARSVFSSSSPIPRRISGVFVNWMSA